MRGDRLKFPVFDRDSRNAIPFVAISIRLTEAPRTHSGVFYRNKAGIIRMLHLRWDRNLDDWEPGTEDVWAVPDIPAMRARMVAERCRSIWRKGQRSVRYAFRWEPVVRFMRDGSLSLCNGLNGLTCSTFVLCVFSSCGFDLLDLDSWEYRDSDRPPQEYAMTMLEADDAIEDGYKDEVRKEVGCIRYSPQDVIGACLLDGFPVSFGQIHTACQYIDESLAAYHALVEDGIARGEVAV